MKKDELGDELRPEYDLSTPRVRKLGPGRKSFGNVIKLEPDVANAFPDADAVNEALRFLIRVTKENRNDLRSRIATASWRVDLVKYRRTRSCKRTFTTRITTAFEPSSKRRRGYPSETRVRRGLQVVHAEKELVEKLGRNDLCPCNSGRRFQEVLSQEGKV